MFGVVSFKKTCMYWAQVLRIHTWGAGSVVNVNYEIQDFLCCELMELMFRQLWGCYLEKYFMYLAGLLHYISYRWILVHSVDFNNGKEKSLYLSIDLWVFVLCVSAVYCMRIVAFEIRHCKNCCIWQIIFFL